MRFDPHIPVKIKDAYSSRHEPEAAHRLGEWYWMFLMTLLALIVIGGVAFGVWEFITPLTIETAESVSVGQRKGVTKTDIVKVLDGFETRADKYEERRVAPVPVKDPS